MNNILVDMWPFGRRCSGKARLVGKTVVITGANTGIGKETARDLYRRGARVILACRDIAKANAAVDEIQQSGTSKSDERRPQFNGEPGELAVCHLNLSSFASVRECAKKLLDTEANIHLLINNAGIMMCPFEKTEDGIELQLQSNYLGHFLLTMLLLPKLKSSTPGVRIINVSSTAHQLGNIHFNDINLERSYEPIKAYSQSKLANVLFTKELARRLKEANIEGITVYSLHPGVIRTELLRNLDHGFFRGTSAIVRSVLWPFSKTPEQGAQTTLHCAVDEEAGKQTGLYYKECSVTSSSAKSRNEKLAARLWDESIKLVGPLPQELEVFPVLGIFL